MSPIQVRPLPYPGHTWSLFQHAVGLRPDTLYGLLQCAAPFEGERRDFGPKITELMVRSNILTSNVRNDVPDAWRDYQQLPAELGLIYSTKISHQTLYLTDLAHMYLAGEIGFSELIGIQALRYQYPNGQKSIIQARLRHALSSARVAAPKTLTQLQAESGILLKPGLLVLRVLLGLYLDEQSNSLSVSECQAFLIPCRSNSEWAMAVADIIECRRTGFNARAVYGHARRNVQDWFKFLACSDYFENNGGEEITLSAFALDHITELRELCDAQEDPSTFWVPTGYGIPQRLKWFDWFGTPPLDAQVLRPDPTSDPRYMASNYVAGIDEGLDEDVGAGGQLGINLRHIDLESLERESTMRQNLSVEELLESIQRGQQKRHAKALLHDRIVKELAEMFIAQGATVESDPDSIDLFAAWPSGESALFEVKTVTQRNFQNRLRSAVGQVQEYAYRRETIYGQRSDRVVVISSDLDSNAWQWPFLTQYLEIGLICKAPDRYRAAAPSAAGSSGYWLSHLRRPVD